MKLHVDIQPGLTTVSGYLGPEPTRQELADAGRLAMERLSAELEKDIRTLVARSVFALNVPRIGWTVHAVAIPKEN